MTKIAVFGANSFSGQDLVDLLLDDPGNEVIGVSRSELRSSAFIRYRLRENLSQFQYHALDLNRDMPAILQLLDEQRPEWVVNFAAQSEVAPSWDHPEHWFQTNCVALSRLINHLRGADYLQRYLHISSPEVYGTCEGVVREDAPLNPSTPYAVSKASADLLLETYRHQFGFPLLTVRATNVYGARQQLFKIIPRSILYMLSGKTIPLHGGGHAVKSYIHIRDISRGELAVLERGEIGQLYHLSPEKGMEVREAVETIADRLDVPFSEAIEIVDDRPGQDAAYVIDSTLARDSLGWRPETSFSVGADETIAWIKEYWDELNTASWVYHHIE